MWCFCFKPSKTTDIYEDEIARYRILDDELLAKGIQESLNQQDSSPPHQGQQEKEENTREVEYPMQYDEDAHVAEAVKQSLKEEDERKQREEDEQVKNDEKIAKDLQNMVESPPPIEKGRRIYRSVPLDVKESLKEQDKRKQLEEQEKKDEQIAQDLQNRFRKMAYEESSGLHDEPVLVKEDEWPAKTVETSLKGRGKRKQFEYERAKKDEQIAKDRQNHFSKMTYEESIRQHDESVLDDEDEQLAKAVEKSLMEKGKGKQTKDEVEEDEKLPEVMNPPPSICGGCKFEIERERSVDISGVLWHPECLWCDACQKPIAIHEVENHVSNSRGKFHKACYERYCYICKEKKMRRYNEHPFWKERYCRTHEFDGTPKCCSCERFEPRGTNYVMLDDRRWLCLECMESAVMDSHECQPLHFEIREYFEGLNMKIEKEFPFLLVEKQALNKAKKEEKIDYQYEAVTRGICLSEAQTVMSVSKATRTGPNIETDKEPQRVVRKCEVTAILILYGFPRLLTGYILAHEMMHAYLRLNGHRKLNEVNEEGICQVLGHMWLESQRYAAIDDIAAASTSSSSSSQTPVPVATSKKGDQSEFEKRLVEFCINQIETDESPVYGDGFRRVNKMVMNSNLKDTLKEILRLG